MLRSALLLTALTAPAVASDEVDDAALFTPMDVFGLEVASDPRIAPDGAAIAYVRSSMDVMEDRRRSDVWLVDLATRVHRPLTTDADAGSPRWSPDGTRLAYAASTEHGAELFVRWMDTGDVARVTQLPNAPGDVTWSPGGERLAFTMNVASDVAPLAELPTPPEGAEWAAPPVVVEALRYRSDGEGMIEPRRRHVFVVPAEGGAARQLTRGDHDHEGPLAWLGDELVFAANKRAGADLEPLDSDLYAVSTADGDVRRVHALHGPEHHPAVSPDGSTLAFLGFEDRYQGYQTTRVHLLDLAGGGATARSVLDDLDRSVDAIAWHGRRLLVQYDDQGTTYVGALSLDDGAWEPRVAERVGGTSLGRPYGGGSFTVSRGGHIAHTIARPDRPADVAFVPHGGGLEVVTALNEDLLGHKTLGAVEEFRVESSHDGRSVHGWIVKPPHFDASRRYPLLLEIHGGPFANYGPRFAAELQLYAASGYVVVYCNPRGSTSYGEEFGNLIHHAYPSHDYDDLMACVDHVIGRGYVDPARLYVTGGSGGGVLSAWIVGKTDRFAAAVVAKPVIDWASFVLTADAYAFFTRYWFPAPPWEDPMHYWARSPLSLVGNVTTPTMLLTGEQDMRTPISQSEEFYQALKLCDVDTALVRIPGASHGIASRPSQLIAKVLYVLGWFDRHGPEGDE